VPKNAKHAGEQRHTLAIDLGELITQETHKGLGHRQSYSRITHI
jgi:hypothetical protein